jgi:uncharacterized protein
MTNTDVYVKTRQQEFNYPRARPTTSPPTRARRHRARRLSAPHPARLRPRRPRQAPLQRRRQSQSRLLMRRNVRDRVARSRPSSPSIRTPTSSSATMAASPGSWMPSPPRTPIPTHPLRVSTDSSINYMRNSVKVVIDAYDGTTTFYVFDNKIPSWPPIAASFPASSRMPPPCPPAAQACALSRVAAQAAGRGLRPLPHDQS